MQNWKAVSIRVLMSFGEPDKTILKERMDKNSKNINESSEHFYSCGGSG